MHIKKMIAPIIISAITLVYYITFICAFMFDSEVPVLTKILLGVIPLFLTGGSIYVLIERIKEIRSGEEDDLGKY